MYCWMILLLKCVVTTQLVPNLFTLLFPTLFGKRGIFTHFPLPGGHLSPLILHYHGFQLWLNLELVSLSSLGLCQSISFTSLSIKERESVPLSLSPQHLEQKSDIISKRFSSSLHARLTLKANCEKQINQMQAKIQNELQF